MARLEDDSGRMPVLTAEDNPVIQTAVRFMLRSWGYDPVVARDGAEAWDILQSDAAPRLAIFDWMMPEIDGVELCRKVRALDREPYTYILLLTGRSDSADIVAALEAGADDYLTKPFHTQELRARLQAGRRIVRLQEQLVAAREALRLQATRDPLTGLLNHANILEALEREVTTAQEAEGSLGVVLADIDRFRQINDCFGHPAGDEVLREAARRFRVESPAGTPIGRYGAEEFLILLPGASRESTIRHRERLLEAISAVPFVAGASSFPVSCSSGVACLEAGARIDSRTLLREASESLFHARRESRPVRASTPQTALHPVAPARLTDFLEESNAFLIK